METIMALKSVWLEIGVAICLGIYAIGAYLKFWGINLPKAHCQRELSNESWLKIQQDESFNNLPHEIDTETRRLQSNSDICYADSSAKVQPDGSFNNLPYGMGTAHHASHMFSDDSRSDNDYWNFVNNSWQLQPDGSFNNLPYGPGTATNSGHDH